MAVVPSFALRLVTSTVVTSIVLVTVKILLLKVRFPPLSLTAPPVPAIRTSF
jgi:hypothetical protein